MVRASRKTFPNKYNHIVCEGHSEYYYVQRLAQFLKNKGAIQNCTFKAHTPIITSNQQTLTDPLHLLQQAKKIKTDREQFQHPDQMYILLDEDTFMTGRYNKRIFEQQCNAAGVFPLFQKHNFEDFLMCHLPDKTLNKWKNVTSTYRLPMTGDQVMQEITAIISDYKKGSIPRSIENLVFSETGLSLCISRCHDHTIPFNSGLCALLRPFIPNP